jgi:hypothetical protein
MRRCATPRATRNDCPPELTRRRFLGGAAAAVAAAGLGMSAVSRAYGAPAAEATPAWLSRDVARQARWLPESVRRRGLEAAYRDRWTSFPPEVRRGLVEMRIPRWMVALVPAAPKKQHEILKQFRFMTDLAGTPPGNPVALRAEQLLIFGGAAQLPTPGDRVTGACLGPEGCTAAISKYVLAQLKLEFPRELAALSPALASCQSSDEMRRLFEAAARAGMVRVRSVPFARSRAEDFLPGGITIAQKPGGTHVFGWTRVPKGWDWYPGDKMAVGNTGLPQFGDHMILAQEYVTAAPGLPGELTHNLHGPINSRNVVHFAGEPDLNNPATNVYAAEASDFILVDLLSPVAAIGVANRPAAA